MTIKEFEATFNAIAPYAVLGSILAIMLALIVALMLQTMRRHCERSRRSAAIHRRHCEQKRSGTPQDVIARAKPEAIPSTCAAGTPYQQ